VGVLADRVGPAHPRLLAGRSSGPVFLGDRRPSRAIASLDLDPASGRARLSYRRAAELFRVRTGWTLHQLRHSALTHAAEDVTNLPLLLARSRHASVSSLERYARPGPEAVARHLAETDPAPPTVTHRTTSRGRQLRETLVRSSGRRGPPPQSMTKEIATGPYPLAYHAIRSIRWSAARVRRGNARLRRGEGRRAARSNSSWSSRVAA
jgi:hypothetical protein